MKTLLIDNYDSYTHILGQYLWEAERRGADHRLRNDERYSLAEIEGLELDDIVISPGPGRRSARAEAPGDLRRGRSRRSPGRRSSVYCHGHQGLARALRRGRVQHAPRVMHGKIVEISEHDGAARLF